MQSLMFLGCFVEKLSKKPLGSARPPSVVKEGLNQFLWFSNDTHLTVLRYDSYQQLNNTNLQPKRLTGAWFG